MNRLDSLDILRGICAFGIMIYHYCFFIHGDYHAEDTLARFGIYGVSIFYVLSGLTMFLVYFDKFNFSTRFFKEFYVKRIFRIYPLMLFVLILSYLIVGTNNSFVQQLIIATGFFSIFDWAANTPIGMWSIGNELCFYLFLPFIFFAIKKGKLFSLFFGVILFSIYFYIAFCKFNPIAEDQFESYYYKNPLNQIGLFYGGVLIGYFFKKFKIKMIYCLVIIIFSVFIFIFFPIDGARRELYIGYPRVVFTLLCFMITLAFYKLDTSKINSYIKKILCFFGEISYSVYLLHGLVWSMVLFLNLKIRYVFTIEVVTTVILSYLVYKLLEAPIRNFGYKILNKK